MNASEQPIFVVGATSSLAQALCRNLAARGHPMILAGRDSVEIEALAADLTVRYNAQTKTITTDFLDAQFSANQLIDSAGYFTNIILAVGDMGKGDIQNMYDIAYVTHVNYTIPAQIAAAAAKKYAPENGLNIVIISSVAGDRGRGKIAAYSSAKAALTSFASALRNHYAKHGVHVLTVKPGFVDTSMTWGITSPLIAPRERVAEEIIHAMQQKRDVLYTPWFWKYIMLIIKHIPEKIFKKLDL